MGTTSPNRSRRHVTVWVWHSVITPSVADEVRLPADESEYTRADDRAWRRMQRIAEEYGTSVMVSSYPLL